MELTRLRTTAGSWISSGSASDAGDNAAPPMLGQIHAGGNGLTDGCYALYGPDGDVDNLESVLSQLKVGEGMEVFRALNHTGGHFPVLS